MPLLHASSSRFKAFDRLATMLRLENPGRGPQKWSSNEAVLFSYDTARIATATMVAVATARAFTV